MSLLVKWDWPGMLLWASSDMSGIQGQDTFKGS
jgi:hypothetical protein